MPVHDAFDDGKAKPGTTLMAAAGAVRTKKRIKDCLFERIVNAIAIIINVQADA